MQGGRMGKGISPGWGWSRTVFPVSPFTLYYFCNGYLIHLEINPNLQFTTIASFSSIHCPISNRGGGGTLIIQFVIHIAQCAPPFRGIGISEKGQKGDEKFLI